MATFKDKEGREWTVEITHGHIGPLKKIGLDLQDCLKAESNPLADMLGDPFRAGQLMWALCRREAEAANISEEDFGYRFNGRTVESALAAVMEAVVDYFPSARKAAKRVGTAFREMLQTREEAADKLVGQALADRQSELTSKLSGLNSAG